MASRACLGNTNLHRKTPKQQRGRSKFIPAKISTRTPISAYITAAKATHITPECLDPLHNQRRNSPPSLTAARAFTFLSCLHNSEAPRKYFTNKSGPSKVLWIFTLDSLINSFRYKRYREYRCLATEICIGLDRSISNLKFPKLIQMSALKCVSQQILARYIRPRQFHCSFPLLEDRIPAAKWRRHNYSVADCKEFLG